jgi:hypothetical protein
MSTMVFDNLAFHYNEKILELLRPWSAYIDLNRTSQIYSLDEDQINTTLLYLSQSECNIGSIYKRRNELIRAADHCQRALYFARSYERKEEMKLIYYTVL